MCIEAAVWTPGTEGTPRSRYQAALGAPEAPPGARIASFLAEVHARFPDLNDLADADQDRSPWLVHATTGPDVVTFTLNLDQCRAVMPWLAAVAHRHGLAFYNANFDEELLPREGDLRVPALVTYLEADEAAAARALRRLWTGATLLAGLALLWFLR